MVEKISEEQVEKAKQEIANIQARKQKTGSVRQVSKKPEEPKEPKVSEFDISILLIQRNTRINNIVAEITAIARDYGQSLEEVVKDVDVVLEAIKPKEDKE